jgi:hypothetical protein
LLYLYRNKPHEAQPPESQPSMFNFQEEFGENKPLDTIILSENGFEEMKVVYKQSHYLGTGPRLWHLRKEVSTDTYPVRKCGNLDFGENKVSIYYMIFQKNDSNDKLFVFGRWESSEFSYASISSLIVFENNNLINDDFAYGEHDYQKLINPIDL